LDLRYEGGRKEGAVRRIILLALVAALMAAMMVVGTGTAFAAKDPLLLYSCTGGDGKDTYVFVDETDVKKVIGKYWEKERGYSCSLVPYDG
jgi:hypothetical protein